ncbi:MAG: cation-translocating P-type ATPase [Methylomicrobium sp.]
MRSSERSPRFQQITNWHCLSEQDVADRLRVDPGLGLTSGKAMEGLKAIGPNRFTDTAPKSPWVFFFAQFKSLLILMLLIGAGLAASIGNYKDASVILSVVFLNAILGFYQEYRAEKSLSALKKMLAPKARVRRDGRVMEISAEQLVLGDIVLLEAGDRIPADGRLFVAPHLEINESTLTGESQPVVKRAGASLPEAKPLAERVNMAFMNTIVTRGRAEMVVVATGMHTEMGRLSRLLAVAPDGPSPLQIQLDRLGKRLTAIAVALVGMLFLLKWLRKEELTSIILDSIALTVASMPEGLPTVVTVTLALGMHRMAKHRAIVKRLASVETLGCTTVICSDKTGTLTLNEMTARALYFDEQHFTVSGEGYGITGVIRAESGTGKVPDLIPLLRPLILCNDSRISEGHVLGDPMEGALRVLAAKGGINAMDLEHTLPRLVEIPFDSSHKFMATFHRDASVIHIFVKGAPDVLLERCSYCWSAGGTKPLTDLQRTQIHQAFEALARQGLRGLLIAQREVAESKFQPDENPFIYLLDLTFLGLIGLMDPPRPEAKAAIALCQQAGIKVKMITGDHKETASVISRELGLEDTVITAVELDRMDAHQLAAMIEEVDIFARVVPEQKVKIVQALKEKGHIVAMTGDGVNDAPALKQADIGIAMGKSGTEVAKEAAVMVLTDDNFATIVGAVQEGRTLYENILKFIRFQLSTTMGAVMTVFFGPVLGLPEPFTPIQILWVALIMDGPPAVALSLDPPRPGVMQEPPRNPLEPILTWRRTGKVFVFGITMTVGTLGLLYYGLQIGSKDRALTLAFTVFVLFQFFNIFNARAESHTTFNKRFFHNRLLWVSLLGVVSLQAVAVHWPPAQALFSTTPLTLFDWALAVVVASSILILEEIGKGALALVSFLRKKLSR